MRFRQENTWTFRASRERVWAHLCMLDRYPAWWMSLGRIRSDGVRPGGTTSTIVRSPIGISMRIHVRVDRIVPGTLVEATVTGDLDGTARLELRNDRDGCLARLESDLRVRHRGARVLAWVLRPLVVWAHDAVLAPGVERFREDVEVTTVERPV